MDVQAPIGILPEPLVQADAAAEQAEEAQQPLKIRAPYEPTEQERADHEATGHVVYRSWCHACLAGKGLGQAHRAAPDQSETAVPEFLSDYGFMGQDDGKCMPLLVLKDYKTKRVAYAFVQRTV